MLRLLLLLPFFLYSQETFLLPDDTQHLMYKLNKNIQEAKEDVYIFTPTLNDYVLLKTLKTLSKKKIPLTIITQAPISKQNQVLRLSLLNHISLYTLVPFKDSELIHGSLVCIDNQELYLLSSDINSKRLKDEYSFAHYQKQNCHTLLKILLSRSKAY